MPEGHQFFTLEGNAVVPLIGFLKTHDKVENPVDAYPYEL